MSFIRKVTWPAVIALSLMLFMGLAGKATPSVQASQGDPGDICGVFSGATVLMNSDGDELVTRIMREETTIAVWAQLLGYPGDDDEFDGPFTAELDQGTADVRIVASLDGTTTSDLQAVSTNEVNDLEPEDPDAFSTGLNAELEDHGFAFDEAGDEFQGEAAEGEENFLCDADDLCADGSDSDTDDDDVCDDDYILLVLVECEEDGAGVFDVSFLDEGENDDSLALEIECRGDSDDDNTTFDVNPATIEIIPAPGNVSHSFARLILEDADGNPAFPGQEVLFVVDKCGIEEDLTDFEGTNEGLFVEMDGWEGAEELFRNRFSPNRPGIAAIIENSAYALTSPDSTEQEDSQSATFTVMGGTSGDTERTVGGAIVHCDIGHTQETTPTPGIVLVTAIVEQDGADDIFTAKITLVGPPATITINASPSELRCGEKAQIVVVLKDSIGQNVSDHTQFEAVTNAGGILGGTGAVIGQAGPVVPISSTVGETFAGTATFFLLTSEQHSGPYEVVVTTGGANFTAGGTGFIPDGNGGFFGGFQSGLGGLFSSPPISVQTTVRCSIPVVAAAVVPVAPVPTITAPRTGDLGTGTIRPPSTGEAGLADASGASWALLAIAGVAVFSLAGLATVKVTRR